MEKNHLLICNEQQRIRISISNILYIKTEDYLSTIYMKDNKKFTCSKPLTNFVDCLPDQFFQISRSVIVNMDEIISYKSASRSIIITDTTKLTISTRRTRDFNIAFARQNITVAG